MPRLGVFSGDELCRLLEISGFRRVRQRGSHVVMQKADGRTTTTVPVPLHREICAGTHALDHPPEWAFKIAV